MMWLELISVFFFGLAMAGGYPCCCGGGGFTDDCFCCEPDNTTPRTFTVTFTGIADGTCDACTDLNSTAFELTIVSSTCRWELEDVPLDCDEAGTTPYPNIVLTIDCSGGPENKFPQIVVTPVSGGDAGVAAGVAFEGDFPDGCDTVEGAFSMTNVDNGGDTICDFSAATATLESP